MDIECLKQRELKTNFSSGSQRYETFEGKKHLVVPVVMLAEGVHNQLLYTAEELEKFPGAWNGIPIPVLHPEDSGWPVSCNDPKILDAQTVGRVFNAHFEDGKLKAELWICEEKALELCRETYEKLRKGEPVEVSTGLWTDDDGVGGVWNGEDYIATVRNFRPDHLALLPGKTGACSWEDGCGAPRWNMQDQVRSNSVEWFRKLFRDVKIVNARKKIMFSFNEISSELYVILKERHKKENFITDVFIHDVWPDRVVYEVLSIENVDDDEAEVLPVFKFYELGYSIEDGKIVVGESEVEVKPKTMYIPVSNVTDNLEEEEDKKGTEETMDKEEMVVELMDKMEKEELIKRFIEIFPFPETNEQEGAGKEEFIELMNGMEKEEIVEKFVEVFRIPETNANDADESDGGEEDGNGEPHVNASDNDDGDNTPHTNTVEDFLANAPDEVREFYNAGLKAHREKKQNLIEAIKANKKNKFSDERLQAMSMEDLEPLAEFAREEDDVVDYTGRSGVRKPVDNEKDHLCAPVPPKLNFGGDK